MFKKLAMFKIGYRTLKTAVGATLAIFLAQFFQLENYASAAVLTIICIQVTKKRSIISSWTRFSACLLVIPFSFLFFETLGYHPISLGLIILFFVPILIKLHIQEGLITSSVILLHFYKTKEYSWAIILNELGIIIIGIGVALLMNLYMPNMERELRNYQKKVEANFKIMFKELAKFLRHGDFTWSGKEIIETGDLIHTALTESLLNMENYVLRHEDRYYHYFEMRQKQLEIIERLLPIISTLHHRLSEEKDAQFVIQKNKVADFLDKISEGINPGNTAKIYLAQLEELHDSFRQMPLPKNQAELEMRASLLHFLREMEQYLIIKRYFKESDV